MSTVVDYHPRTSQPPPPPAGANDAVEKQRAEKRKQILREAVTSTQVRHDWTKDEIAAIYYQPVLELAYQAVSVSLVIESVIMTLPSFEIALIQPDCRVNTTDHHG
jgi:hypothetical protein